MKPPVLLDLDEPLRAYCRRCRRRINGDAHIEYDDGSAAFYVHAHGFLHLDAIRPPRRKRALCATCGKRYACDATRRAPLVAPA